MSEPKKKQKPEIEYKTKGLTCTCYTVAKASATTAQSYEIRIENGVVVSVREISRAPDKPVTVISRVVDFLWPIYREQSAARINETIDE